MKIDASAEVEVIREALRGKTFRITFNETYLLRSGASQWSARFEVQGDKGRWKRVGPLLFGPDNGDLEDLLEVVKFLTRDGETNASPQTAG